MADQNLPPPEDASALLSPKGELGSGAPEENWDNEGGHMSSTAGRITHVRGADLPYLVELSHHGSDTTEHAFATMRSAEAFIKRNTPVPGRSLSALYDRPASDF